MEEKQLTIVLERIANSLEKIAERLEYATKEQLLGAILSTLNNIEIPQKLVKNNNNDTSPQSNHTVQNGDSIAPVEHHNNVNVLIDFLAQKHIHVKTFNSEEEADVVFNRIAFFMGERYLLIRKFYERIKSTMNSGHSFMMSLKDETQESISSICALANELYRIAFLEEYSYQKSPRFLLYARPNRIPKAINFFTGQWLERFVKESIVQLLDKEFPMLSYHHLLNAQIVLPNGKDFELDLLFQVENQIYWFEAKTGEYQKYVDKYSKVSQYLELDKSHSFMILIDRDDCSTKALSDIFSLTVVSSDRFAEEFKKILLINFEKELASVGTIGQEQ